MRNCDFIMELEIKQDNASSFWEVFLHTSLIWLSNKRALSMIILDTFSSLLLT